MSSHLPGDTLVLPERPNLRHLKDQAADLLAAGRAASVVGCAIPDCARIRICELAQAQGACRVDARDRPNSSELSMRMISSASSRS